MCNFASNLTHLLIETSEDKTADLNPRLLLGRLHTHSSDQEFSDSVTTVVMSRQHTSCIAVLFFIDPHIFRVFFVWCVLVICI